MKKSSNRRRTIVANGKRANHRKRKQLPRKDSKPKIAVLLNQNARKVNAKMVNRIKSQAPDADIFVTSTMHEAEQALSQVATGKYDLCFTGGGDGTVCHAVTRLSELSAGRKSTPIGVLPLGTGNAIASYLDSPNIDDCVTKSQLARLDSLAFPEMVVPSQEGGKPIAPRKAAFGGFGWDAFVLDRYFKWRDICKTKPWLKPIGEGLLAYLIAGLGWAVPELLLKRPRWQITVKNGSKEALQVKHDGTVIKRFAPGEVMYEGPARLFSFGTCPYFGFKLKALPLAASNPHQMQVRIADFSPLITALYLPKIWTGRFTHPRLWDFLASEFEVTLSDKAALQMGGDVIGRANTFKVNMSTPAPVLRFGEYQGIDFKKSK